MQFWIILYCACRKSVKTSLVVENYPSHLLDAVFDYYGLLTYIANFLIRYLSLWDCREAPQLFLSPASFAVMHRWPLSPPCPSPAWIDYLALMCQISHNLPVESAIQAKTGTCSGQWQRFELRPALLGVFWTHFAEGNGHANFVQTNWRPWLP